MIMNCSKRDRPKNIWKQIRKKDKGVSRSVAPLKEELKLADEKSQKRTIVMEIVHFKSSR